MKRLQYKHLRGLALHWKKMADQYEAVSEDNEFIKGSMMALLSCYTELERLYMEDPVALEIQEQNHETLKLKSREGDIMGIRTMDFEKEPPKPKTFGELLDFLEQIPDEFHSFPVTIQQENDIHYIHYTEFNEEVRYYHPEAREEIGCLTLKEWEEHHPEFNNEGELVPAIKVGQPMVFEDF